MLTPASLVGFICWCVRSLPSGLFGHKCRQQAHNRSSSDRRMIGLAAATVHYSDVTLHVMTWWAWGLRLKQQLSEGLAVASVYELRGKGPYIDRHCTTSNSHPTNERIEVLPASRFCVQPWRPTKLNDEDRVSVWAILRIWLHMLKWGASQLLMLQSVIRCHRFPTKDTLSVSFFFFCNYSFRQETKIC